MPCINPNSLEFKAALERTGNPLLAQFEIDDAVVKYRLKSVNILDSDKAVQLFNTLEKNKVTGDAFWNKVQNDLQIPKSQIELLKQYNTTNREELITNMLADYSYTIEINTAMSAFEKTIGINEGYAFIYQGLEYNAFFNPGGDIQYEKDGDPISEREYFEAKKIGENEISSTPTQIYSNLTVPGGTNYTENEVATPAITPSIKGHAQFATDKGIGWFRSDDKAVVTSPEDVEDDIDLWTAKEVNGKVIVPTNKATKTRRILEVQSDLFQKGRDKEILISPTKDTNTIERLQSSENQFLQLLNKDNNWVTFFAKSIVQDSAKKGYEKVLFPTGSTAYKIESGGNTLEDYIKNKETRLKELESVKKPFAATDVSANNVYYFDTLKDAENYISKNKLDDYYSAVSSEELPYRKNSLAATEAEINTIKREIKNAKEGASGLAATAKFYEDTLKNVLNKQYGKQNVKQITDEYGNTWNELTIEDRRDLDEIYFQLEEPKSTTESNEELNTKIEKFLEKIGVSIQAVNDIRDKNGEIVDGAVAKANMLNKIIQIVEGKASLDTLPEEAAHFFVEMLGEGHPLYKQMYDKITGYQIYTDTVELYKSRKEYRLGDNTLNYDKLKKEAMGRLIAEHIVRMEPGAESENRLVGAINWWQKLWEWVKNIFQKADENPFEDVASKILLADTSELTQQPIEDEVYYQLTDPLELLMSDQDKIQLDNSIDPRTAQKRHIYTYEKEQAKGSVTSVYVDAWLKKIFRTDSRSELQKIIDLAKAEFGDVIHEQIQDIIKSWTNPDGTKRATQGTIAPKVGSTVYTVLNKFIQGVMNQYDEGTVFKSEVKIYDKKTKIAGSIDLLVIKPDGVVDIYDWKTQQIFANQTDIKTYKEPMYRIQLENYRKILELQYGFTKFGKIRAIPIATQFNMNKTGIQSLRAIEIGSLDITKIPEDKSYLLPVTLRTESTGDERLDALIERMYGVYDKIESKRLSGEELFKKREELNQLRLALRDLQLKNEVNKLVDIGLLEYKKYTEKLNSKTLTGKDIQEALTILEVFGDSGVMLSEYREEIRQSMDEEKDKEAIKKFEATDRRLILMSSKVTNLISNIKKYRDEQSEQLAERNGIMKLLDPEKKVGAIKSLFSSLSNITQKSFRVFSKLLRVAQNQRDARFDAAADKLKTLKDNFVKWAQSKGMSTDKAMEMILNIDEKGNWNGNFLNIYKPEFYKEKEKAIEQDDAKWLLTNLVFDDIKYKEAEERQIAFFKSIGYAADEKENEKIVNKKIKEWIDAHKVTNDNNTLNRKALFNPNNSFLKPKEEWFSDKWKNVNKPENAPLKEMYNYFQSLIRQSEKIGMLDKYSPHFIPSILSNKMDQLVFGNIKDLFSGKGLFENLEVDSGTKYSPEVDPTNGQVINRIPVYFTKDMGVQREDGTYDYGKKSRDLFKVFGVWAAHLYSYEAMDAIEGDALMLLETERNKKSLVTDNFGNVVIEGGRVKAAKQNDKNAKLLEDFINYYLYDRLNGKIDDAKIKIRGKEYSALKTISSAIKFFGLKTLAFNVISGTANFVGGKGNALFMAQKGIFFTKKTWAQGMQLSTGNKKAQAALVYLNILQEGNQRNLIDSLSLSGTNRLLKTDNLFIVQRTTDKLVQYPIAVSLMINHMVVDGKIVDIQQYVKNKYDYNNTFYNLSKSEQKAIRDKIDKEVEDLQNTKSLLKIGELDKDGKFSIPGIDKDSETMSDFRSKIKGVTKKILGNNSRDDINGIRTGMLGTAAMQFRNWMPEMVEERFGGLQYDDELGVWTYGKLRQFLAELLSTRFPSLLKSIITGFGSDAVQMAKNSYERMKRKAYEQGEDFTITEGEFIDMYIGNLKSQVTELTILLGFAVLIFSIVGAGDDEDETSGMKKYLSRALNKYYSEFLFYYNPLEFTRIVNKPLPVVGLGEDFYRFLKAFTVEIAGDISGNEDWSKSAKPTKYFFKMVPVAKEGMLVFAVFDKDFRKDWDIKVDYQGFQ
jgi:hypothetical protein